LKAGTKAFGKVTSSRANPRKSGPLTVELASIDVNGRRIPVKTSSVQPASPPQTARQAHYGHTAGTTVVNQAAVPTSASCHVLTAVCLTRSAQEFWLVFNHWTWPNEMDSGIAITGHRAYRGTGSL
jgi:hypothetical protein